MKKILLVVAISMLTGYAFAQKTYNLQFKPKQGEKYDAVTNMKSTIKQSMMGQEMVVDLIYDVDMLYDITKSDENTSMNMTYTKLSMDMAMMGQNIKMSSEDPDDSNPASKSFKSLKGSTLSIIIAPDGKVTDVQGTDALAEKFADLSLEEKEALKIFISKENIKSMMEQSFKMFPDKPVKVGDSWASSVILESPYKLTSNNTYKLLQVENGVALVDVTGTLSTNGPKKMTTNGMEISVDLSGSQKGVMELDQDSGTAKSSKMKQVLSGKMEVMGQEIPMEVVSDIDLKMTKK